MDNYPPGPMTGQSGPLEEGCLCVACPFLNYGLCDCEGKVCDECGQCSKHCQCFVYGDEEG